jgi:hypothetical protein
MLLIWLLLFSTRIGVESAEELASLPRKHPLEEKLGESKASVAALIEETLVGEGVSPRLARAATINAYAESGLVPTVIGDHGRSVGVFQLNINGLGHDMSIESRQDVETSALKVARYIMKDKTLVKMQEDCAPIEDMIKAFTIRVMRPSNMRVKAAKRAALGKRLLTDVHDGCVPV